MLSKNKLSQQFSSNIDLNIVNLSKKFNERTVLKNLNLNITPGEFVAIVGRSGCGKSTLLKIIAGLEEYEGDVFSDNQLFTGSSEAVRVMFQEARLLPWKNVFDNVLLGLPLSKIHLVKSLLESVGLSDRAGDWPSCLSGGQRQRVALARALAHRPRLLLLDEPLGALDALTRIEMQRLIEKLWQQHKFTAILVTHDVQEAVMLADRVVVIEAGHIVLDYLVKLARPRRRDAVELVQAESMILNRLLDSGQQMGSAYQMQ
ncbi:MAG: ATP-binding cassette domain-containing protein [Pseudomonadota bacterium]